MTRAVPYDEERGSPGWDVAALVEQHDRSELFYAARGDWVAARHHARVSGILESVVYRPRLVDVPVRGELL